MQRERHKSNRPKPHRVVPDISEWIDAGGQAHRDIARCSSDGRQRGQVVAVGRRTAERAFADAKTQIGRDERVAPRDLTTSAQAAEPLTRLGVPQQSCDRWPTLTRGDKP